MEPMVRIELTTDGLRNRCSTTELHWLENEKTGIHSGIGYKSMTS
jgi:hypothetical protein